MYLLLPLKHDHAANAENVIAAQPDWLPGDAKTHRTQVIVQRGYNIQNFFGNRETSGSSEILRQIRCCDERALDR